MKEWKTEEQKRAAQSISSAFGGPTKQEQEPDDSESLWSKVKAFLKRQVEAPSFGESVTQQLKKRQQDQLTIPKK